MPRFTATKAIKYLKSLRDSFGLSGPIPNQQRDVESEIGKIESAYGGISTADAPTPEPWYKRTGKAKPPQAKPAASVPAPASATADSADVRTIATQPQPSARAEMKPAKAVASQASSTVETPHDFQSFCRYLVATEGLSKSDAIAEAHAQSFPEWIEAYRKTGGPIFGDDASYAQAQSSRRTGHAQSFPELVAAIMKSKSLSKAKAVEICVANYPASYGEWRKGDTSRL